MNTVRRTQVIAREKQLVEAMRTSDVGALDRLLHDDLVFNGPTGETATKAMDLANHRSGNIRLRTVEASERTIRLVEDSAMVAVTVFIQGSYLGQEIDGRFRYLRVWKLVPGGWKVIAGSVIPLGATV